MLRQGRTLFWRAERTRHNKRADYQKYLKTQKRFVIKRKKEIENLTDKNDKSSVSSTLLCEQKTDIKRPMQHLTAGNPKAKREDFEIIFIAVPSRYWNSTEKRYAIGELQLTGSSISVGTLEMYLRETKSIHRPPVNTAGKTEKPDKKLQKTNSTLHWLITTHW